MIPRHLSLTRERIIDAARRLAAQGDTGPAVVVAEVAVEVQIIAVLTRYLTRLHGHSAVDADAQVEALPSTPDSPGLMKAFKSITGQPITEAPAWKEYVQLLPLRHHYVHHGEAVSPEDAHAFINAVDEVSQYVEAFAEGV